MSPGCRYDKLRNGKITKRTSTQHVEPKIQNDDKAINPGKLKIAISQTIARCSTTLNSRLGQH